MSSLSREDREKFFSIKHEPSEYENFELRETFYIAKYSNLKLSHPDLTKSDFDFDNYEYRDMIKSNTEKLKINQEMLRKLECSICGIHDIRTIEEYQKHLKDKHHKHNLTEFKQSIQL